MTQSRRDFMKTATSAAILSGAMQGALGEPPLHGVASKKKPNIILYVADQVRWDFIGALGMNPTVKTPNLDAIAKRGVMFTHAVTNQPLCSPSRACMMTGRYATETGMWKLPPLVELNRDLPTLATVLRSHGYTANFMGKWHLAPLGDKDQGSGFVKPEDRGGFLDVWEGANVLGTTSQPFGGSIWNAAGEEIKFDKEYRADFITDRAVRFLEQPQEKPFLLFISQQEPHQQNNVGFIAPEGYAEKYQNPFVPPDLLNLPGDWQQQLPGYYGSMQRIDETVGRLMATLQKQGLLEDTIFIFTSDHSNHFRTRNGEYKRSAHDSSIRVPLLMQGPGLNLSMNLDQIVGNIDLTPTLLDLVGVPAPNTMKGKSAVPLLRDPEARAAWKDEALIQISGAMVGRAIRTKDWTYCIADQTVGGNDVERGEHYSEYQMYNNASDPAQLVNLAGRNPYKDDATRLRDRLSEMVVTSGEPRPAIQLARLYP